MSRVFWDTNLFIYLFEDYGKQSQLTAQLRQKMLKRGDELLTSTLAIGEVLTGPEKTGNKQLCKEYEEAIRLTAIVVNFDLNAAKKYALLRSRPPKISPPDAIQLACAAAAGVDLFLTNDTRLHNLHIDRIQFITSVDRAPI